MSTTLCKESYAHKELSKPLLGLEDRPDLDETEIDYEEEDDLSYDVETACCFACTDEDVEEWIDSPCSSITAVLALPVLLVIQFALPYFTTVHADEVPTLVMTLSAILLFTIASLLYKYSLPAFVSVTRLSMSDILLHLLPEVWANVVLACILLTQDTHLSLQMLLVGNLVLSAGGAIRGVCEWRSINQEDELDTSYYQGLKR